jgi:hypothetical protein
MGVDCIYLAQNEDQMWTAVNAIIDFEVPHDARVSRVLERLFRFSMKTALHGVQPVVWSWSQMSHPRSPNLSLVQQAR